ncbi:hypothetical protein DFR30_2235 [Thiogranum longum]|uniref:Uncharacterized protein n=1 Tax=Thiogranum longum TaxID=1537524 RepID=A0A4R1HAH6_9GAMM|nr:hypothetical protein [Thiogranum longum]TCK18947.1 hypothetical protein DFR30_2235 [Thiogranum longum]
MMRSLGRLVVAGPHQAVLVVAICTILSFLLPPVTSVLGYVAAAALALNSLQRGARSGAIVLLAASGIVALLASLMAGQQVLIGVVVILLLLWAPLWLASVVLRETRSLAMAMLALSLLGMLGVVLIYVVVGDPVQWWPEYVSRQLDAAIAVQPELRDQLEELSALAERVAPVLAGSISAGLVMNALLCLTLGRWWQAVVLERPGAVRAEFYALRFNRSLSLAGIAIFALASLDLGIASVLSLQWALVVMVPFMFVGLAVAHATLSNLKAGFVWLVIVYIVALLAPQLLVAVGILDPWLDPRRRTDKGAPGQN